MPLEVLMDGRCESESFDRLVPQTDATLQYDKFNQLRLRNKVSSVGVDDFGDRDAVLEHLRHHTVG